METVTGDSNVQAGQTMLFLPVDFISSFVSLRRTTGKVWMSAYASSAFCLSRHSNVLFLFLFRAQINFLMNSPSYTLQNNLL